MLNFVLLQTLLFLFVYTLNCQQFSCDEKNFNTNTCTIRNFTGDFKNFELQLGYYEEQITSLKFEQSTIKILSKELFKKFSNLTTLHLNGCNIEKILPRTFQFAVHLTFLNLSYNSLSELYDSQFFGARNLVRIDLTANKIRTINGKPFNQLNKLRQLNLSENKIITLDNDNLRNMPNLTYLDLSKNSLRFNRSTDSDPFSSTMNLKVLILKSVQLDPSILAKLPKSIEILDISSNNLKTLDLNEISKLQNLTKLLINDNHLGNQTFRELKNLFPRLKFIDISQNDWKCIDLTEMLTFLKELDIQQVVPKNKIKRKLNESNDINGIGCVGNLLHDSVTVTPQPSGVIYVIQTNHTIWFIIITILLIIIIAIVTSKFYNFKFCTRKMKPFIRQVSVKTEETDPLNDNGVGGIPKQPETE